jgi:hypothetical protein
VASAVALLANPLWKTFCGDFALGCDILNPGAGYWLSDCRKPDMGTGVETLCCQSVEEDKSHVLPYGMKNKVADAQFTHLGGLPTAA